MVTTIVGIVSIFLGFCCVMAAYYTFQRGKDRRIPTLLGLAGLLFLTVIPVAAAVFFAVTQGHSGMGG